MASWVRSSVSPIGFSLGQRHGQALLPVPPHTDEHLVRTLLLPRHADHLHLIVNAQRRDRTLGDAGCGERELELVFEIVVPAHRPLVGIVRIHDDFHLDTLLSFITALRGFLGHGKTPAVIISILAYMDRAGY